MKRLTWLIFGVALSAALGAVAANPVGTAWDAPSGGSTELSTDTTPALGGDLNLSSYDIHNGVETTDTAADVSSMRCGESSYALATPTGGGACIIGGGIGVRKLAVTNSGAGVANDTLTLAVQASGATTSTSTVITFLNGAQTDADCLTGNACNVDCSGTMAECATNLAALLNGATGPANVTAVRSTTTVGLVPAADVHYLTATVGDVGPGAVVGTVTSGADGQVVLGGTFQTAGTYTPTLTQIGSNSGVQFQATQVCLMGNNTAGACMQGGGFYSTALVQAAAASNFSWTSRSIMTAPADYQWRLTGSTASNGSYTVDLTGFDKGETATYMTNTEVLTFAGGGEASKTTSTLIPDGAFLKAVVTRVVTPADAAGCTTCDYGDGTDVDLYGDNIECDVDATTTTNADWTANIANPQLAAGNVKVTANGGNCANLVIRITAVYETFTAPTTD